MEEQWRAANSKYEVSSLGRVRSLHREFIDSIGRKYKKDDRILKLSKDNAGYPMIDVGNGGTRVHRLVAELFIPNPDNKETVNHKDGNKSNNCIDNLEWNTYKENSIHAFANGLVKINRGESCFPHKLTEKQVIEIRNRYREGDSSYKIAKEYGMDNAQIWRVATGKSWRHIKTENIRTGFSEGYIKSISREIIRTNLEGIEIDKFPSISEAGRQLNLSISGISNVLGKRSKSCGGFLFKYL